MSVGMVRFVTDVVVGVVVVGAGSMASCVGDVVRQRLLHISQIFSCSFELTTEFLPHVF